MIDLFFEPEDIFFKEAPVTPVCSVPLDLSLVKEAPNRARADP
jgi:hypothetical protein